MDVAVVGGATFDVVVCGSSAGWQPGVKQDVESIEFGAGGGAVNASLALHAAGARVRIVCALGGDKEGEWLRTLLGREGIDLSLVQTVAGEPTGKAVIHLDDRGEARVFAHRGASTKISPGRVGAAIPNCELLYVAALSASAEAELHSALATGRNRRPRLAMNPGAAQLQRASSALLGLVAMTDLLCVNEAEARLLARNRGTAIPDDPLASGASWIECLQAHEGQAVLVTLGAKGAVLLAAGNVHHHSSRSVQAASTLGAGDAFCSTFAYHWAMGASVADCFREAQSFCALVLRVRLANLAGRVAA